MTNKELNRWNQEAEERLIKACEHLGCEDGCPYVTNSGSCSLKKDALDLINRQKAEIEQYKDYNAKWMEKCEELKTEIERLLTENHSLAIVQEGFKDMYKIAKAEAVKEFAEKLEAYIPNIDGETTMECVKNAIKQTLKEVVGESK